MDDVRAAMGMSLEYEAPRDVAESRNEMHRTMWLMSASRLRTDVK